MVWNLPPHHQVHLTNLRPHTGARTPQGPSHRCDHLQRALLLPHIQPMTVALHVASCFTGAAGSESWLLSLGPHTAPAGSTLVLQVTYTASFGQREGLWRSAAYTSKARPGQQVVALSSALETSAARMVLPCLDEPRYKVRAGICM
jgi:hypothetical protein